MVRRHSTPGPVPQRSAPFRAVPRVPRHPVLRLSTATRHRPQLCSSPLFCSSSALTIRRIDPRRAIRLAARRRRAASPLVSSNSAGFFLSHCRPSVALQLHSHCCTHRLTAADCCSPSAHSRRSLRWLPADRCWVDTAPLDAPHTSSRSSLRLHSVADSTHSRSALTRSTQLRCRTPLRRRRMLALPLARVRLLRPLGLITPLRPRPLRIRVLLLHPLAPLLLRLQLPPAPARLVFWTCRAQLVIPSRSRRRTGSVRTQARWSKPCFACRLKMRCLR